MTLTCPCCKASNETATCRRCRADLGLLAALEERRAYHVTLAERYAAEGWFGRALENLDAACELRAAPDVRHLRAAVLLLAGDFTAALAAHG